MNHVKTERQNHIEKSDKFGFGKSSSVSRSKVRNPNHGIKRVQLLVKLSSGIYLH